MPLDLQSTMLHDMHEDVLAPCVYGCSDCKDTFCHYLECPVLWQLAREVLPEEESSRPVFRLALVAPSARSLDLLAVAFNICHDTKNNHAVCDHELDYSVPNFVQHRAAAVGRALRAQFGLESCTTVFERAYMKMAC